MKALFRMNDCDGDGSYGKSGDLCGTLVKALLLGPVLGPMALFASAERTRRSSSCGCGCNCGCSGESHDVPDDVVAAFRRLVKSNLRPGKGSSKWARIAQILAEPEDDGEKTTPPAAASSKSRKGQSKPSAG
jgi:hypothetical protein